MRPDDEVSAKVERFVTAGVDIGARAVKIALLAHGPGALVPRVLAGEIVAVRGRRDVRDAQAAVREGGARVLRSAGMVPADIALIASTGAKEFTSARVGHFYRRLSLAAGVRFLFPGATAVLDVGARQMRCALLDKPARGRGYVSTAKGASWGGEVLEPIARANGVAVTEAGRFPAAVAAYDELAARALKLMRGLGFDGLTAVTGALALDPLFVRVLARRLIESRFDVTLLVSPDAVFAGAYGAALLAARRYLRAFASTVRPGEVTGLRRVPWAQRLILN